MDIKVILKTIKMKIYKFYEEYKDILYFIMRIIILIIFGIILMHIVNISSSEIHNEGNENIEMIKKDIEVHKNFLRGKIVQYLSIYRNNSQYKILTLRLTALNSALNNNMPIIGLEFENKINGALSELSKVHNNTHIHLIHTNLLKLKNNIKKLKRGHGL